MEIKIPQKSYLSINWKKRKKKAIKLMTKLGLYQPFINEFKNNNKVAYFENHAGYWAEENPELYEKIKEIEHKYNYTVYAVTHERQTYYGELYDFLIVPGDPENWSVGLKLMGKTEEVPSHNIFSAFSYVWYKNYELSSDLEVIMIDSFGGGIKRIG